MKVIDLLQRIANGEEVPKKVSINAGIHGIDTWVYDEHYEDYKNGANEMLLYSGMTSNHLNDEVEVIEEKEMCHKCGKYPAEYNQTYCEFCLGISEEDKKIEKLDLILDEQFSNNELQAYIYETQEKVNEIIDKINKE